MTDVGGVSGSRQRAFSEEEVDAMGRNESTSTIVNKARRDAGFKEGDVSVRGDDKTLDEVLHQRRTDVSLVAAASAAADAMSVAEAAGMRFAVKEALGVVPEIALPAFGLIAAHVGMIEMEKDKAAMKDGATRDQLHAAILDRLDLPPGFKDRELKRLHVSMAKPDAAARVSSHVDARVATLQLHCDEGMHAARTMLEGSKDQNGFLKANPAIAKRYAEDVAFHNGFDALCWTKSKEAPPGSYDAQLDNLNSRDARYDAANITLRM